VKVIKFHDFFNIFQDEKECAEVNELKITFPHYLIYYIR